MPLDGLRAWIGEVERKLGLRTRVFLVLVTIAIGVAGAAIYLAIDTRESAVSESDVRALQERLEERIGTGGTAGGADLGQLEAEVKVLGREVDQLRGEGGASGQGKDESPGGTGTGGSGGTSGGASAEGGAGSKSRIGELLEEAKRKNEETEAGE
jgi:hypothetical protein